MARKIFLNYFPFGLARPSCPSQHWPHAPSHLPKFAFWEYNGATTQSSQAVQDRPPGLNSKGSYPEIGLIQHGLRARAACYVHAQCAGRLDACPSCLLEQIINLIVPAL